MTSILRAARRTRELILTAIALGISLNSGWAADNFWTRGAGNLNWNVDGNWNQGGVPQADPYEEIAVIENGDTVFLAVPASFDAAGIDLGRTAATFGGLEIRSGGLINNVDSAGTPNGTVNVGVAGQGSLVIQPGGSLTAQFFNVNGQSTLTVGGAGSPATLSVAGAVNLNGMTRVTGAGHTVSGGGFTFGGASTLVADVRSAGHSPLRTNGLATINGNLMLEFGGGFSPTVGTIWNIVDAGGIVGAFDNVDLSAAPTLGPGEVFRLATVPGGNGQLLQLQYRNVLTLNVNWDTKAVSISSPSGEVIDVDGYSILSASGGLNVGQWNSLQNQGVANWFEATPTPNALNELNDALGGSLSVGSAPRQLGTPFAPVIGSLGQSPEDLVFEYTSGNGEIVEGLVAYTGNRIVNNLLLTVDPATGEEELKNSSPADLSFDGYSILSASGSLLPSNGNWLSLADQGMTGWEESTPTATALNELLTAGVLTLASGQSIGLGALFDEIGGTRDLVLEFTRPGEPGGRIGAVLYEALQALVDGDYNNNGVVDAADYTVWRNSLGQTGPGLAADGNGDQVINQADYTYWKTRFGNTSGAGSVAVQSATVPEPSGVTAACIALATGVLVARRLRFTIVC